MHSNYLRRNPTLSILNIKGLPIGQGVIYELNFDKYHSLCNNIYRLTVQMEGASNENGIVKVSGNYAGIATRVIPDVMKVHILHFHFNCHFNLNCSQ